MMSAAPARRTTHRVATLDVAVPSWMRAPGEIPGMFAHEVAMDELAVAWDLDPIELRIRNEPEVDPETGLAWNNRRLLDCLQRGADRFGWADRPAEPGTIRDGDWWVGTGMAAATYPTLWMPGNTARIVALEDGRYAVSIGAVDIGAGARTVLSQIAADALEVEPVRDRHAHRNHGPARGHGGRRLGRDRVVGHSHRADRSAASSRPRRPPRRRRGVDDRAVAVLRRAGDGPLRRPLRGTVRDPRYGHVVTQDLATYHVASHADVVGIEGERLEDVDTRATPFGGRGIGEIGIVGTAAAIANAAWHATGIRVRDLPLPADKFL